MPSTYAKGYGVTGRQQDGAALQQEKLKKSCSRSDPVPAKPDQATKGSVVRKVAEMRAKDRRLLAKITRAALV